MRCFKLVFGRPLLEIIVLATCKEILLANLSSIV